MTFIQKFDYFRVLTAQENAQADIYAELSLSYKIPKTRIKKYKEEIHR
jgi:predicted transcriptional regulator